jgi:hypothetical protein
MYVRKSDLFVGTAIILYIVFFALSPPAVVRTVLSNPAGMAACFGVAVYTALYHSRAIGALLIVALLASMTQVSEHLTNPSVPAWSPTKNYVGGDKMTVGGKTYTAKGGNIGIDSSNSMFSVYWQEDTAPAVVPAVSPSPTPTTGGRSLAEINKEIDYLKSVGLTETSENDTMKKAVAERNALQGAGVERPQPSTPAAASPPTTPPPAPAAPPKPVMSCNIENFASY